MGKYNLEKLIKVEVVESKRVNISNSNDPVVVDTLGRCILTFEKCENVVFSFKTLLEAEDKQASIEKLFREQMGRSLVEL